MKQKLDYLTRSALNFFTPVTCPNCGSSESHKIDQKYFVTRLFECAHCHLQFRHPVDSKVFNDSFYQADYSQKDGITTDLPAPEELKRLVETNFEGSNKNIRSVLKLFESLGLDLKTVKVVDYGCSWGYMTWQFRSAGISVQALEISKPRAAFGNSFLDLSIKTSSNELSGDNDVVFSSHVIEHVPSIPDMIADARRLLKPDGMFIAESPNGSFDFRKTNAEAFHHGWGLVHPNYLSDRFYKHIFRDNPYFITSTPLDAEELAKWDGKSQIAFKTGGPQLLLISRPNRRIDL